MARLTIFRDGQSVMEHALPRPVTALGRHTDNDIVLDDLALSRFHARIERRGDKHLVVDLGSQNGVFVNGARIQGEQLLRGGDRVGIGRYVAVYDEEPARGRATRRHDERAEEAAAEPGQAQLALLYNGAEMERFPLAGDEHVIGRSHKCDIVIGLLGLSRRHARVYRVDEGGWAVEDLGSQNGTFVNDERIEAACLLQHGDVINFFEYSVVYQEAGADDGVDSTAVHGDDDHDAPQSTSVEEDAGMDPLPMSHSGLLGGSTDSSGDFDDDDARGFEVGATEMDSGLPPPRRRTRTATGTVPGRVGAARAEGTQPPGPSALWPTERDTEEALTLSGQLAPPGLLEVRVDGRLVTEVPLDRAALRIGSDARCDVALPPLTSISAWHLVLVRMGATVVMTRVGDAALPRVGGRAVAQAFLQEGDLVELGRVTLACRRR